MFRGIRASICQLRNQSRAGSNNLRNVNASGTCKTGIATAEITTCCNVAQFSSHRGTSITSQLIPNINQQRNKEDWRDEYSSQDPRRRHQLAPGEVDYSVLHERISSAGSTAELLDLVEGFNSKSLDERALMTIIHTLFRLVKSSAERSEAARSDILNSVGMQKVCKILRAHCRWMTPNDLLSSTKVLIFLNAPASHPTLGTLLHLLSKHANSLTLHEIIYLHFLLHRTPETPTTSALLVALPIVFESQLQLQLDTNDLTNLTDSLQFAARTSLSDNTIHFICEGLMKSKENLNSKQAISILWSMTELKRSFPYQEALLKTVFKILTTSINSLSFEDLATCANKISRKFGKTANEFYDEDFMNALCSRILTNEIKPAQALFIMRPISVLRHVNIDVLDQVCDVALANPTLVLNSDFIFFSLIRAFSGAHYKPEKWDNLAPIFLEHPAMTKDLGFQAISLAVDFLSINVLPTALIAKIFSETHYDRLEEFVVKGSPHLLLLLYNAVKLLYEKEYLGPLPPTTMVQKWKDQLLPIPKMYPLKGALHTGLGGENYVVTGLYHEGFHIDHGVVMRKGGYPISMQTSEPEIFDRLKDKLPPESVLVMVKAFMAESYARNTNRLRGVNALELRLLEKLGHPVVAIDISRWRELQDYEKIPYLMQRIREKSEKIYQSEYNSQPP